MKMNKRKVSFLPVVTVHPVAELSGNDDEKRRLYYSPGELNSMSRDAKAIIKMYKEMPASVSFPSGINAEIKKCIVGLHEDFSLRGLELYLCPTRVMNTILTGKAVMKYQNALKTDSSMSENDKIRSLADVCTKLSRWSQEVALETARLDSIRSHGEDFVISSSEPVKNVTQTQVPEAKRRRVTCEDDADNIRS